MKYSAPREILEQEDDAQLAWEAIEPFWDDFPLSTVKRLQRFLSDLTKGQRALIAIDWCQKEIRNGGFPQLFGNSTGNLVPWAIDGFRLIGADKYAAILLEAANIIGSDYLSSSTARMKAYRALNEPQKAKLKKLEDDFFELLGSQVEDLETYRGRFVRSNPGLFIKLE